MHLAIFDLLIGNICNWNTYSTLSKQYFLVVGVPSIRFLLQLIEPVPRVCMYVCMYVCFIKTYVLFRIHVD